VSTEQLPASQPLTYSAQLPGTGLQMARIEKLGELLLAKCENLFYVTLHKDLLYDPTPKNGVTNSIAAKSTFTAFFKTVFMNPTPIRTLDLFINKPEWRLPDGYPGSPPHWNPVNPHPVVDECPNPHFNVTRRENFKVEPRWSHRSQVFGIGEKWKNDRWGRWKPKLRGE
jgi:hypothetical protein